MFENTKILVKVNYIDYELIFENITDFIIENDKITIFRWVHNDTMDYDYLTDKTFFKEYIEYFKVLFV